MEDKINMITEEDLENVSGGRSSGGKHVEIVGCVHSCNVRSTPDSVSDKNILGQARRGDRYTFRGWSGSWAKVQYGAKTGYIYKRFIDIV